MIHHLFKTEKFVPDAHKETIHDIDFEKVKRDGKQILLIDIDNTLISYDDHLPNARTVSLIEKLKSLGFFIVLVSNNSSKKRVRRFSAPLNLSFVCRAKKPLKSGFKKALRYYERPVDKKKVLVIGDQMMTDVYGAKRTGLDVILVLPIKKRTEKWYTRLNRAIENRMLEKIKTRYPEKYTELKLDKR